MFRLILSLLLMSFIFQATGADNTPSLSAHSETNNQLMVLADIHFSPFADCQKAKNCVLITKLNQAEAAQWPQILAQYSNHTLPTNGEETNYTLFHSVLMQIQRQKPKHVLILGDFLAHRYRSQYLHYSHDHNRADYERFVIKTMIYITNSIQQALPAEGGVYPVIGNNDSYGGKDCTYPDYCVIANGSFYKALANSWSALFRNKGNKANFTTSFPHAGYYEIILPHTHNHIIILNTVLFSSKVQGANIDREAENQLQWLKQKLQQIADAKEKTWIIYHIPPGIDAYSISKNFLGIIVSFWDNRYSTQFLSLIHQYNSVVTAALSGHIHMDGFLILDMKSYNNLVIDTFVASISPIYGNNPSYKIYSYSDDGFLLHNVATYSLNLRSQNTTELSWQ